MQLVPALCTQCKGELKVDPEKKTAVCLYCKTTFLTEEAINYYNMTVVNNIGYMHADVLNMSVSDEKTIENRVKAAETFLKLDEYIKAEEVFSDLTNECPYDYRGWWGLIRTNTRNLTDYDISKFKLVDIEKLYKKVVAVGINNENENICEKYAEYVKCVKEQISDKYSLKLKEIENRRYRVNEQKNQLRIQYEERRNQLEKKISLINRISIYVFLIMCVLSVLMYFYYTNIGVIAEEKYTTFFAYCVLVFMLDAMVFVINRMICTIIIEKKTAQFAEYTDKYSKKKEELQSQMSKIDTDKEDVDREYYLHT